MVKYHTESGSIYEVDHDHNRIRKLKAGAASNTRRVVEDWRVYLSITGTEIGGRIMVVWGQGRDAVSDELGTDKDAKPWRFTLTSPVVGVER